MLKKSYIRQSTSSYAALMLIVKKLDNDLRICVDYRALNALIIRNRNALPLIRNTLVKLYMTKWYIKFDIIVAFNEIRIKKKYEEKTTFLTRYDLFEYIIMLFDLCNASSTFQAFINDVLREYLNMFCSAYLNDILIYSNNKKKHVKHVKKILEKLKHADLYLNINKCEFHIKQVKYLELIIIIEDLKMNSQKIDTIRNWKASRCVKDI